MASSDETKITLSSNQQYNIFTKNAKTAAKEHDDKEQSLSQAKDRAQLTATGAMSVVHIALLKEVLDEGPAGNKYYEVSLVLICIALTLQIIAGIVSIVISHMRSYYDKHQVYLMNDACENLFCCKFVWTKTKHHKRVPIKEILRRQGGLAIEEPEVTDVSDTTTLTGARDRTSDEHEPGCCGKCCPFDITSNILKSNEYCVVDKFEHWLDQVTDIELLAAQATLERQYLVSTVQELRRQLENWESKKDNYTAEEFKAKSEEISAKITEAQSHQDQYVDMERRLQVANAKGNILRKKTEDIRKNQVLKMATFWQQILNILFFIVFVINAFITGLGLSNTTPTTAPTAPQQIPSPNVVPGNNETQMT